MDSHEDRKPGTSILEGRASLYYKSKLSSTKMDWQHEVIGALAEIKLTM